MNKKQVLPSVLMIVCSIAGALVGYVVYRSFIPRPVSAPSAVEPDTKPPASVRGPKLAENETARSQDRLFYDFRYFSTGNQIRLDFSLQENDAHRNINGFTIERATVGEPTLAGPTTVSIGINGKKAGDSDWDCKTMPTQIECVGTEILQLDLQGTLTLSFGSLPRPPYKLTINLLEQGQSIANFTSLLQQ